MFTYILANNTGRASENGQVLRGPGLVGGWVGGITAGFRVKDEATRRRLPWTMTQLPAECQFLRSPPSRCTAASTAEHYISRWLRRLYIILYIHHAECVIYSRNFVIARAREYYPCRCSHRCCRARHTQKIYATNRVWNLAQKICKFPSLCRAATSFHWTDMQCAEFNDNS
jgi:hypothetical protein